MLPPIFADLPPTAWLLIGLTLFLLTVFLARGLVRARAGRTLTRREGLEVMVAAAVLAGGLWGAPAWYQGTEGSFPFPLAPFDGRLLAAAGALFALVALVTLIRPSRPRLRFLMAMLLLYLGPWAAALILWHRAAVDWTQPATWGMGLALLLLIPGALIGLLAPVGLKGTPDVRPPSRGARVLLGLAGLLAWGWGLALYVMPAGPLPEVWLWAADPLTSRLMASIFFALAGAALIGAFAGRHSALALWLLVAWGAGIGWAVLPDHLAEAPLPWAWIGVWGAFGVLALLQLMIGANVRFRAPDPEPEPDTRPEPRAEAAPEAPPPGRGGAAPVPG